ncbi:hypothetical protein AVEN_140791-1, partial [Araneus ventricosus]
VSPFLVEKAISSTIGEIASIKKLRSGDLLVEVTSRKQAQQILKLKALATIPVNVSTHRTLNSSKGVITCGELLHVPLEEISEVVHSRSNSLPALWPFQRYLPRDPYLRRCAVASHDSTNCEAAEQCVNCKGQHTSFSRSCPKWKLEKKIITTKVKQNISFSEARRLVQAQTPTVGRSYASATKTLKACETQTKRVVILTTDSDQISSPTKRKSPSPFRRKKFISKSQKALTLKVSKQDSSVKSLKSRRSLALDLGKAGLATKDMPSLFGNPSSSELLKIHPSDYDDDDDDLQMSCEASATPLTGVDNSPPSVP